MRADKLRRVIGVGVVLHGLTWIGVLVGPSLLSGLEERQGIHESLFVWIVAQLFAVPGVLSIIFGVQLWREANEPVVKRAIGVTAGCGAFWLVAGLFSAFPDSSLISERLRGAVFFFVATLVAVAAYLFVVQGLLSRLLGENRTLRSLLGVGIIVLTAFAAYSLASAVLGEALGSRESPGYLLEVVRTFAPVVIAVVWYRLFVSLVRKEPTHGSPQPE